MKSFSEKLNEDVKPYEDKDIRSVIYDIVESKLSLNNTDSSLSISGKEELVEKLLNLMEIENLKETIEVHKAVYNNPMILQEECDGCKKSNVKKITKNSKESDDLEQDEKAEIEANKDGKSNENVETTLTTIKFVATLDESDNQEAINAIAEKLIEMGCNLSDVFPFGVICGSSTSALEDLKISGIQSITLDKEVFAINK